MSYENIVLGLNEKVKERRPEKLGDWRDENGILHCGVCNQPLEHILYKDREPPEIGKDLSFEQKQRMQETIKFLKGRTVRCICKCVQSERKQYEDMQKQESRRDRQFSAFGNSMHLANTNFSKDNFSKPKVTETLTRYINKFTEIHEKGLSVILSGEQDSGKTFFSLAVANALIDKGYTVSYSSLYKILSKTSPYVTYQHIINTELFADMIIIEDVNEDCFEPKQYQVLLAYINTIKSKGIPIMITTRLSGDNLNKIKDICKNASIIKVE